MSLAESTTTPVPTATAPTPDAPSGGARPGGEIPYGLFLDCVHCGLCTSACPTYVTNGDENDSPRGRIYLMRGVVDGRLELNDRVRHHLDLCLDCRACETACPSGVQYGQLIEPFRVALRETERDAGHILDWFHRWILFGLFPNPQRLRRALLPAYIAQRLGIWKLLQWGRATALLPQRLRALTEMLPPLRPSRCAPLPEILPAKGRRRARVALFLGCVGDAIFRHTHWATARVLQENGCDVVIPSEQVCCGAIHFHAGSSQPARDLADRNVAAFAASGVDAVIVNVAGCGAMLKDYGHHWPDAAQPQREALAGKVRDVHEFLDELGLIPPEGPIPLKATYHDACHLCHAQKVHEAPRNLLASVPELKLVDLPESEFCCGAAGTYNLTQPEMAAQLGARKLSNISSTGAQAVITGNAGCLLQIRREAHRRGDTLAFYHPMDILDHSYRQLPLTL